MFFLDSLLNLLYPPRCAFCHRLLRSEEKEICRICAERLPYTGESSVREKLPHIDRCVAPFYYEKHVRDSLLRFKFERLTGYAGIYAQFMVKCIDENAISCDIITWVSVSGKRKRERGYDQAELLAKAVAKQLDKPCVYTLNKIRHTPRQSRIKSDTKRKENVKGAYRCISPELICGKSVLLIDDIVTSGSTLAECARVLKEAGAAAVCAASVAMRKS